MLRPSKSELNRAFGTDNLDKVVEFILVNGKADLSSSGIKISNKEKEKAYEAHSRKHVEHTRVL
jgi:ribosome maturation protein Sdo1